MKCFGCGLKRKTTLFQNVTCEGCRASTGVYQAGRINISNSSKPEHRLSEWLCFPTVLDTSQLPVRWHRRPWCGITWQEVWHQCLGHFLNTKHVGVKQLLHLLSVRWEKKKPTGTVDNWVTVSLTRAEVCENIVLLPPSDQPKLTNFIC